MFHTYLLAIIPHIQFSEILISLKLLIVNTHCAAKVSKLYDVILQICDKPIYKSFIQNCEFLHDVIPRNALCVSFPSLG